MDLFDELLISPKQFEKLSSKCKADLLQNGVIDSKCPVTNLKQK